MVPTKILLLNARSVRGKINSIQVISSKCDILCITKTHLDPSYKNDMILDSSHKHIYRVDRDRHGGGVLLALSPNLSQEQIFFENSFFPIEVVCVRIGCSRNRDEFFVLCLYISPKLTRQALEPLDDLLSLMSSDFPGSKLLVVGDFNFPDIDWKNLQVRACSNQKALHRSFLNCLIP